MNSEELELSLRAEFENYLKDALAGVRQEVSGLQEKIEAEMEKHKSQLEGLFQDFAARLETEQGLDPAFSESVVEHMRLARDEGARITATAIAEAEDMKEEQEETAPVADFSQIRDAIADISSKTSQSAILKSLIHHAAHFTPRGAFFIIKNEHFVGWRVFGKEGHSDEQAVREVYFPISADTVLGQSVRSLTTAEGAFGTYSDDTDFLSKLEFGQPDKMYSVPLVARGRGVAVLYADYGTEGVSVNVEAIEALVGIAGLTVELLAASQSAKAQPETSVAESSHDLNEAELSSAYAPAVRDEPETAPAEGQGFAFTPAPAEETETETEFAYSEPPAEEVVEAPADEFVAETPAPVQDSYAWSEPVQEAAPAYEPVVEEPEAPADLPAEPAVTYEFESTSSAFEPAAEEETPAPNVWETLESPQYESPQPEAAEEKFEGFESQNGSSEAYVPQPAEPIVETVAAQPVKTRFSDRNVDLPIEVAEDERRLHNDARRFARLLVSEVKLYNEQKVKEGREARDLYERLREAIDRSREMYDKRVQPPVASKFDYFHYELVSTLAEGDEQKLGESYPGANV